MKKKIDGAKMAAELLQGLGPEKASHILDVIKNKDPKAFEHINANLVTLKHLKVLTPKMLQEFLLLISVKDLGLALRTLDEKFVFELLIPLSSSIIFSIEESYKGSLVSSKVIQQAEQKIVTSLQKYFEKHKINPHLSNDPLV